MLDTVPSKEGQIFWCLPPVWTLCSWLKSFFYRQLHHVDYDKMAMLEIRFTLKLTLVNHPIFRFNLDNRYKPFESDANLCWSSLSLLSLLSPSSPSPYTHTHTHTHHARMHACNKLAELLGRVAKRCCCLKGRVLGSEGRKIDAWHRALHRHGNCLRIHDFLRFGYQISEIGNKFWGGKKSIKKQVSAMYSPTACIWYQKDCICFSRLTSVMTSEDLRQKPC